MNHWLDALRAAGLSEETVRCRRNKLSHTARCIGLSPMTVTAEDLINWTSAQAWKTETRRGYRKTYVSFFRWLHESGRRPDDPSELLPVVRRPKPKPRPCPDRYIIAALHKATPLERIMLRLAAECGLRRSEIARVNSRDVMDDLLGKKPDSHRQGRQAAHRSTAGRSGRLHRTVRRLAAARPMGRPCRAKLCQPAYLAVAAGRVGCHSLRHRYATKTYEQTHDLFLVARLLGHSSVETTQIYVAMPDSRLRSALGAVRLAV